MQPVPHFAAVTHCAFPQGLQGVGAIRLRARSTPCTLDPPLVRSPQHTGPVCYWGRAVANSFGLLGALPSPYARATLGRQSPTALASAPTPFTIHHMVVVLNSLPRAVVWRSRLTLACRLTLATKRRECVACRLLLDIAISVFWRRVDAAARSRGRSSTDSAKLRCSSRAPHLGRNAQQRDDALCSCGI
jgi:hypothetical protein